MEDIHIKFDLHARTLAVAYADAMQPIVDVFLNVEKFREAGFSVSIVEPASLCGYEGSDAMPTQAHESSKGSEDERFENRQLSEQNEHMESGEVETLNEGRNSDENEGVSDAHDFEMQEQVDEERDSDGAQSSEDDFHLQERQAYKGNKGTEEQELRHVFDNFDSRRLVPLCIRAIELWIPNKREEYPYSKGEESRPPKWPQGVDHIRPSRLRIQDLRSLATTAVLHLSADQLRLVLGDPIQYSLESDIYAIRARHDQDNHSQLSGWQADGVEDTEESELRRVLARYCQRVLVGLCYRVVEQWMPRKHANYPYSQGEKSRPLNWPQGVPHTFPAKLQTKDLQTLVITAISHLSTDQLMLALGDSWRNGLKQKGLRQDIYKIRARYDPENHNQSTGWQADEVVEDAEKSALRRVLATCDLPTLRDLCYLVVSKWIPGKPQLYPYSQGEKSRPPNWPLGVRHTPPTKMWQHELQTLAITAIDQLSSDKLKIALMSTRFGGNVARDLPINLALRIQEIKARHS